MFFERYFQNINTALKSIDSSDLNELAKVFTSTIKNNKKVIFAGNGGSSSIAGHLTVDCINAAKIKAVNFNDSGILTCFSNDYGYENWISKSLECYADHGDVIVLISSSGQSKNMIIGANRARSLGLSVVTLTGFSFDNPLRELGDINLWIDSSEYNVVEMTHHVWLLAVVDYIIEKNKDK